MVIRVCSNWGDASYVGMNGVEFYDSKGRVISFKDTFNSIFESNPLNYIHKVRRLHLQGTCKDVYVLTWWTIRVILVRLINYSME